MTPPAGFEARRAGDAEWWLRPFEREWMEELLRAVAGRPEAGSTALHAGRGGARLVSIGEHRVVIRPYRRGGLPGRFIHDLYLGWRPRPFRELIELDALRARGVPVVEVCGAAVRWVLPGCYRGWLATRYVDGARTLWQWASTRPEAKAREMVYAAAGRAVRRLHDCGGQHPDLNLNNILVSAVDGDWQVHLIDFDRPPRLRRSAPAAELARLRRSARKLDPDGQIVTAEDLDCLEAAYRDGSGG